MHLTHFSFFRLWPSPYLLKKATFDSIFLAKFIEKRKKTIEILILQVFSLLEFWTQIYGHPVDMIDNNYDLKVLTFANEQLLPNFVKPTGWSYICLQNIRRKT